MTTEARVLDLEAVETLDNYRARGGGRGLVTARRMAPLEVIEEVQASGLRGRGGAGFPTGVKWRTVAENLSPTVPPTVVANGAEGEPGSFKDRAILRRNPYRVLEGALIAASAVGADRVVFALKGSFRRELDRLRAAIGQATAAGWAPGIELLVVEGPAEYLYGEETALLEVVDGRRPFPRIAPPFRHGVDEVGADTVSAAQVTMSGPEETSAAPPALVNNVETLAHVAGVLAEGPDWFRALGTPDSPGTIVCTVSGRVRRHGVAEVPMGTPLREVIEIIGGGAVEGRRLVAAMSGVANPLVPESLFDTATTYEAMQEIGSGLGAAGFIVFDDGTDLAAVAHGVSRFLSVESCGQCTPCKQDGLALSDLLLHVRDSDADAEALASVEDLIGTVANEARCFLAHQHSRVLESVLALFGDQLRAHIDGRTPAAGPELVSAIVDIEDGRAVLDEAHAAKQPDWSFDETYSGQSPADSIDQRH